MLHQAHIIAILASVIYYKKSEMKNNYVVDFNSTGNESEWQLNPLLTTYNAYPVNISSIYTDCVSLICGIFYTFCVAEEGH